MAPTAWRQVGVISHSLGPWSARPLCCACMGLRSSMGDFTAQQRQRVSSVFYILAGADGLGHDYNNSLET